MVACAWKEQSREATLDINLIVTGMSLAIAWLLFPELMVAVDDQMNWRNWLERARMHGQEALSLREAVFSWPFLRITSIVCSMVVSQILNVVVVVGTLVAMAMGNYTIGRPLGQVMLVSLFTVGYAMLMSLVQFQYRRLYTKHGQEASPELVAAGRQMEEVCSRENEQGVCTFYFVSAEFICSQTWTSLPKFQARSAPASSSSPPPSTSSPPR